MSDKALQLIDEIRFRSLEIKGKLDEERQNNAVLTNTIADLGKELEQRELELSEVKTKVAELENQPAYIRKKIELEETSYSSETVVSRFTLGEDSKNQTVIKSDNSFLHDNVD